jgi:glycine oxidase
VKSYDVIVIGDGVIGSACAYVLAREKLSVLLVGDGRPGATAAAAGMLCPDFELTHDAGKPKLAELLSHSAEAWERFASELSDRPGEELGYQRQGAYGIGYHARPRGSVQAPGGSLPAFSQRPSFFAPKDGSVEPELLLSCLYRRLVGLGGERLLERAVLSEDCIRTKIGEFAAGHVVLATGADPGAGPELLTGVEGEAFLVRLRDPGDVPRVVRSPTAYFVPRKDGTLYIGATENWPGAIPQHRDELWRDAVRLLPGLSDARLLRHLQGLRPFVSRDGPLVVRDRERPDLIRAQGHYRNGVLLAPATADTVKDLVLR